MKHKRNKKIYKNGQAPTVNFPNSHSKKFIKAKIVLFLYVIAIVFTVFLFIRALVDPTSFQERLNLVSEQISQDLKLFELTIHIINSLSLFSGLFALVVLSTMQRIIFKGSKKPFFISLFSVSLILYFGTFICILSL